MFAGGGTTDPCLLFCPRLHRLTSVRTPNTTPTYVRIMCKALRFAGGFSPPATLPEGSKIEQSVKDDRMFMTWRNGRLANSKSLVARKKPAWFVTWLNGRLAKAEEWRKTKAFWVPHAPECTHTCVGYKHKKCVIRYVGKEKIVFTTSATGRASTTFSSSSSLA